MTNDTSLDHQLRVFQIKMITVMGIFLFLYINANGYIITGMKHETRSIYKPTGEVDYEAVRYHIYHYLTLGTIKLGHGAKTLARSSQEAYAKLKEVSPTQVWKDMYDKLAFEIPSPGMFLDALGKEVAVDMKMKTLLLTWADYYRVATEKLTNHGETENQTTTPVTGVNVEEEMEKRHPELPQLGGSDTWLGLITPILSSVFVEDGWTKSGNDYTRPSPYRPGTTENLMEYLCFGRSKEEGLLLMLATAKTVTTQDAQMLKQILRTHESNYISATPRNEGGIPTGLGVWVLPQRQLGDIWVDATVNATINSEVHIDGLVRGHIGKERERDGDAE